MYGRRLLPLTENNELFLGSFELRTQIFVVFLLKTAAWKEKTRKASYQQVIFTY